MSLVRKDVRLGTLAAVPSRTRLAIADGISFNEWLAIGEELFRIADSNAWWLGDWYAYGVKHYHKNYALALDRLKLKYQTLANQTSVARNVESSRRREDLSWSHHAEVASLDGDDQERILDDAFRHGYSVRELREIVRAHKGTDKAPAPHLTVKAVGELYAICAAEAERRGTNPADWAQKGLAWLAQHGSPHLEDAAA